MFLPCLISSSVSQWTVKSIPDSFACCQHPPFPPQHLLLWLQCTFHTPAKSPSACLPTYPSALSPNSLSALQPFPSFKRDPVSGLLPHHAYMSHYHLDSQFFVDTSVSLTRLGAFRIRLCLIQVEEDLVQSRWSIILCWISESIIRMGGGGVEVRIHQ